MDEDDWAHTLAVFRACLPRRGRKAADDRRFLEALHFFTVDTAPQARVAGALRSLEQRVEALRSLEQGWCLRGVLRHLAPRSASMSHSIQMFDLTIVRARVSAAGAKGGKKAQALGLLARRLHHQDPRKIGRLRRHHRLRSDPAEKLPTGVTSKPCSTSDPTSSLRPPPS